MITYVCFKGFSNHEIVTKLIPIKHNFKTIPKTTFNGRILPAISISTQVINYLDEIDKSDIMAKYDFDIIFDYYIPKRRNEIADFINYLKPYITKELQRPIEAIISESKDILFGKGKSNKVKAKELFIILNIANKSINGTLNTIIKITDKVINTKKLK